MEYIILDTQEIVSQGELRKRNPDTSFPAIWDSSVCEFLNVSPILLAPQPEHTELEIVVKEGAITDSKGNWFENWVVKPMFSDIKDEKGKVVTTKAEQEAAFLSTKLEQLKASIVVSVQSRLDDFAKTRNYDGILSACTYATSSVAKFAAEGQYCVEARDNTWSTLYTILTEVEAGTRTVSSFADIEADLPVLEWV
jgi:hypothetical protein